MLGLRHCWQIFICYDQEGAPLLTSLIVLVEVGAGMGNSGLRHRKCKASEGKQPSVVTSFGKVMGLQFLELFKAVYAINSLTLYLIH